MKGEIIHITENEGIILTDDGKRYKFNLNEWKSEEKPSKGDIVDFIENGEFAKEVILLKSKHLNMPDISTVTDILNSNDLKSIKLLGGIGSVCLFFTWIPYLGFLFAIAGLILLTIAIKKLSDKNKEENIFKNWLIALIISLLSYVMTIFITGATIGITASLTDEDTAMAAFGIGTILLFIFIVAIQIVLGIIYKKVFSAIGVVTNEKLFNTAANFFFWGGILYIVVIGAFLFFIGWILVTIAFFGMKTSNE